MLPPVGDDRLPGRRQNVTLPPDLSAIVQPITVQVQNSDGFCWEAVYQAPPLKQTAEELKDKDKP